MERFTFSIQTIQMILQVMSFPQYKTFALTLEWVVFISQRKGTGDYINFTYKGLQGTLQLATTDQ